MQHNNRTYHKTTAVFILLAIITSLNWFCSTSTTDIQKPAYSGLNDTVKYVGINTCKECHRDIYDTYIHTGMGSSFDKASKEKSSADFDHHQAVYDSIKDFYYRPFWDGDSLCIAEFRLSGTDTIFKRIENITYIVGSGQHTNSHISNKNGYLFQIPLTYYTQKGQWDLPPGFENGGNTRFSRMIGLECMTCHNSYPQFAKGSENKYEFVDNGINCERCHGPGEVHVNNIRNGKVVDISTQIDYSIVNPAKLPIDLQFDICQRCHIQGNAVLNDDKSFFDFKPGMHLSDVMNVFMPVFKGRENEHIMASHAERLKLSKCYIETSKRANEEHATLYPYKNALTCVTCHDPHVSVKVTGTQSFNTACSNCHVNSGQKVCTEDRTKLSAANNNCVGCHMPGSGTIDIPHVTVHDHFIRKPVPAEELNNIREFIGINCINNPQASSRSRGRAFIAYFEKFNFNEYVLDSAEKYFSDHSEKDVKLNFHELVQIAYLRKDYSRIITYCNTIKVPIEILNKQSFDNKDAWTSYRIGEAYDFSGKNEISLDYFKRAFELAPYFPQFANKYGSALIAANRIEKAKIVFKDLTTLHPEFPQGWSNLGYTLLLTSGDTEAAGNCYDKALSLDPDYVQALINKAGLLAMQGKTSESLNLAKQVLLIDPDNNTIKKLVRTLTSAN